MEEWVLVPVQKAIDYGGVGWALVLVEVMILVAVKMTSLALTVQVEALTI